LDATIQRALLWLNACTLLRKNDLYRIAWPPGADRQRKDSALRLWVEEAIVASIEESDAFRLGAIGAAKLRDAGLDVRFENADPAYRVRTGLLLAGQFAVALGLDLLEDPNIVHLSWTSTPFSGVVVRPDAVGGVCYQIIPRSAHPPSFDVLHLVRPDITPTLGQTAMMRILLEIDLRTETDTQLEQRAERWGTAIRDQRASLPPNSWPYVVWVTDGGWDRAQTIWRAWMRKAELPFLITTTSALQIDGRWRPWQAAWRDEHGRPRTLNPHASWEPIWRFEASPEPQYASLEQAINGWEAAQRV